MGQGSDFVSEPYYHTLCMNELVGPLTIMRKSGGSSDSMLTIYALSKEPNPRGLAQMIFIILDYQI